MTIIIRPKLDRPLDKGDAIRLPWCSVRNEGTCRPIITISPNGQGRKEAVKEIMNILYDLKYYPELNYSLPTQRDLPLFLHP